MKKAIVLLALLVGATSVSYANVTVQGWWHLDSSQPITDSSGLGRSFTAAYSTSPTAGGSVAATPVASGVGGPLGKSGYSSTQSIQVGLGANGAKRQSSMWGIGYNPPAQNYGIEVWVLPQDNGVAGSSGGWILSSGSSGGVALRINSGGDSSYIDALIIGKGSTIGAQVPIDTTRWTHLAIVNDGGITTFYTNGVPAGDRDTNNATTSAGDAYAISAPGDNAAFYGYLDEARLFTFDAGQFSTNDLLLRPFTPNIVVQPQNATVWLGGAAVFDLSVSRDDSTTYQWRRGGVNLSGATDWQYYLPTVTQADDGAVFSAVVKNFTVGSVTSSNATLKVVPLRSDDVNYYRSAVRAESGLIAYFTADSDTGTTLSNVVDAQHNATLEGTASFDGRTNRAYGVRSLRLGPNSDGDATIPSNPAYEFPSGNGTIEAIVYLDHANSPANKTLFGVTYGEGQGYYTISVGPDGSSLLFQGDSTVNPATWGIVTPLLGRQAHVAVVLTNQTITAYVDGQSLGTKPNPGFGPNSGAPAVIGAVGQGVAGGWSGTIDELAIYQTALSAETIAVHNSRFVYGTNVSAPKITSQPSGTKNLLVGGSPVFAVTATGTAPIHYQWRRNGTDIPGATSATLTLSRTTTGDAGSYTVVVSNPVGSVTNDPFTVNFTAPTDAYATLVMQDNPSAYWRLDETSGTTAFDLAGAHDGTYAGSYTQGTTGVIPNIADTAVRFNAPGAAYGGKVEVPYSPVFNGSGSFSVEAFIIPNYDGDDSGGYVISSQLRGSVRQGWGLGASANSVQYDFFLGDGSALNTLAGGPHCYAGVLRHVAAVYDGTNAYLYVDGALANTWNNPVYVPNPSNPLDIAVRNGNGLAFDGVIDEVAFYGYALSGVQVSNHWATLLQPSAITQQPVGVTNVEGSTITLTATASGYVNTYQWQKNGVNLDAVPNSDGTDHFPGGVTGTTLTIAQTTPSDSGNYRLVVANKLGGSSSTAAKVVITADTNAPTVDSVTALGTASDTGGKPYLVKVVFSKRVDIDTAQTIANYSLSPSVTINQVVLPADPATAPIKADWRTAILSTAGLTPGQKYSLTISHVKDQAQSPNTIATTTVSFKVPTLNQGGVVWDYYYLGTSSGNTIDNLTSSQYYPDAPQASSTLTAFDSTSITSGDLTKNPLFGSVLGEHYGAVVSGWLTPTVSGDYYFFLASDDGSQLYLGTDATPGSASLIAEAVNNVSSFQEPGAATTSAAISLVAGHSYYIRALQAEGAGGDFVKVAWRLTTDTTAASNLNPIPAQYLSAYAEFVPPSFGQVTASGGKVVLNWTCNATLQESKDLKTWTPVAGSPESPFTVTPGTDAAKFYRLVR